MLARVLAWIPTWMRLRLVAVHLRCSGSARPLLPAAVAAGAGALALACDGIRCTVAAIVVVTVTDLPAVCKTGGRHLKKQKMKENISIQGQSTSFSDTDNSMAFFLAHIARLPEILTNLGRLFTFATS